MDASREDVIEWARNSMCDFSSPVFPPPPGWAWAAEEGGKLSLTAIFMNTEDKDITAEDIKG